MEFEKCGVSYILNKDKHESDDVFYKRAWYIINKIPLTEGDLAKIITLSKIWASHKYNGCVYTNSIMNKIS